MSITRSDAPRHARCLTGGTSWNDGLAFGCANLWRLHSGSVIFGGSLDRDFHFRGSGSAAGGAFGAQVPEAALPQPYAARAVSDRGAAG